MSQGIGTDEREDAELWSGVPRSVLAVGPVVVLLGVAIGVYTLWPFGDLETLAEGGTAETLIVLTAVGGFAGIVPVTIGMLWFPFIRSVGAEFIHAFIAFATGVLLFITIEMVGGLIGAGAEISLVPLAIVTVVGILGTFLVMFTISRWRVRGSTDSTKTGLQIAFIVAIALGLHSIGEGLAIGVSMSQGEATLVMLLVLGFVIHNVLEGIIVVSAMARDTATPQLRYFGAVGLIAGGPVILGGWFGSLGTAAIVAVAFYAIAIGAILQAVVEMVELVHIDAGVVFTRMNLLALAVGFALMFVLEDVIVDGWLLPA